MNVPETRYAKTLDGVYIAYQTVGDGPIDIVWQFDWLGNVDTIWEYRPSAEWFRGLASFSRLILHDRRGTGASSRNVDPPNLETRVADLTIVLDAVGSERPVLGGALQGGAPNILFAATFPERVHSLFWWYRRRGRPWRLTIPSVRARTSSRDPRPRPSISGAPTHTGIRCGRGRSLRRSTSLGAGSADFSRGEK